MFATCVETLKLFVRKRIHPLVACCAIPLMRDLL